MPSITIWNRIEPRCRSLDFNSGLEARVHDPLWLLGRQWQVGEFEARDAGSPVVATVQSSTTLLDRFSIAGGPVQTLDRTRPIEMLVEGEAVRPAVATSDFRQAIEAGLYFLRLAATKNLPHGIVDSYLAQYPIAMAAEEAQPISSAAAGRVIDGINLYADLTAAGNNLPALPAIPAAQHDSVLAVTREWLSWYTDLFSQPTQGNGWSPDRMEYSFAVAPGTTSSYVAQEYDGGAVDWYTFNRSTKSMAGAAAQASSSLKGGGHRSSDV
jgi:hypothetical protein